MPSLFGLKLVPVLAASVVFYLIGFLWYGVLFQEAWMTATGVTEADAQEGAAIYMAGGFLITITQVVGIGLVLKWKGSAGVAAAVMTTLLLWLFLALPFSMYAYLYQPAHSSALLMIDASHLLAGWLAAAGILGAMN